MMRNTTKYKLLDCTMFLFSPKKTQSRIFLKIQTLHTQRKIPLTISQRSMIDNMLVTQSCSTLCDSMDCTWPGSSVHWILQAGILEWVTIPFSRGSSRPRDWTWVSALQADPLLSEPPGKPISRTGVHIYLLLKYWSSGQFKVTGTNALKSVV